MSTIYYYLRAPITRLLLWEGDDHDKINVWVSHEHAGMLIVPRGQGRLMCSCFADYDREPPVSIHFDGFQKKFSVSGAVNELSPTLTLVSEHGEPHTVIEIKARARSSRQHHETA